MKIRLGWFLNDQNASAYENVCEDQICVEAPDPCEPNPCGPGAEASSNGPGTTCQCTCPSGFLGDPYQKCIQV